MTAHKPHAAMKDSGVAWLGKIPKHWDIVQSRRMFDERKEKARPGDVLLTASQKYGMIPQSKFIELEGRRVVEINKGANSLIHVEAGDFVISLRSFQGGLEFSSTAGSITFHYVPIHAVKGVHEPFFAHLFKSSTYIQALRATANLIRDGQDMRFSHFAQVTLPVIPMKEQVAIADHLDREVARIDNLIARKTCFIGLLAEKRQALITSMVTKGLNPKVKMKDSGVAWLGKVPEHWEKWKVSHAFRRIGSGTTPDASEQKWYEDGTICWVTTGELREGVILDTASRVTTDAIKQFSALKLHPAGALVVAMYGATIGRMAFLGVDATTNQACCVLSYPTAISPKFFFYWFLASKEAIIGLYASGGAQPNINKEKIADLRVPCPDVDEQDEIAKYLDEATARIDALIAKTERSVELLREHRTALITAAVTGKIDLRENA